MEHVTQVLEVIHVLTVQVKHQHGHIAEGVNTECGICSEKENGRDKKRNEIAALFLNKVPYFFQKQCRLAAFLFSLRIYRCCLGSGIGLNIKIFFHIRLRFCLCNVFADLFAGA